MSAGLSFTELAHLVGINPAMPSRYENRDHSCFCSPRMDTWQRLNEVLFPGEDTSSLPETDTNEDIFLIDATVEEIVTELKTRGAKNVRMDW